MKKTYIPPAAEPILFSATDICLDSDDATPGTTKRTLSPFPPVPI